MLTPGMAACVLLGWLALQAPLALVLGWLMRDRRQDTAPDTTVPTAPEEGNHA